MTEPYYEDEYVTLYHDNNLNILPQLSGIDLVFTSPPYNLNGDNNSSAGTYFKNLENGYDTHTDNMPHNKYVEWQQHTIQKMWDTLTDTGAIFYNHKPRVGGNNIRLPLDLIPNNLPLRQIVIWDRGSGMNRQFTYYVPRHEWIMIIAQPKWRTTTRSVDDVWKIPFETGSKHPAPFPIGLPATAIETTAPKLVLDPFAGSGTTLVAAKRAGVKVIGIEKSEKYCEMAVERLAQNVIPF